MESIRYIKVPVRELRIGMYVVELDRPWLETPFLVQGFVIKSIEELEILSDTCAYVYVDTGRSRPFHKPAPAPRAAKGAHARDQMKKSLGVQTTQYRDSSTFSDELTTAKRVYRDYETMVERFYEDVRRHQKIDISQIHGPANEIVESVIRNPDACMLLAKLKRKGDYNYNHAIGCSIWAAAFGRELGLPKNVLVSVATGAMLLDVGKIQISDRLLNKIGTLTPPEQVLAKSHVIKGLRMLEESSGVDKIAYQMVTTHHERHNGSGYPRKLQGKDIPVYGRIAGIVDAYDALISDKPYRAGIAPSEAIRIIYNVRNVDFQEELVEVFIQSLGVYPAGSIVELSSGEVGIVVSEHRHRRLRPKLLILLDGQKNWLPEKSFLDLSQVTRDRGDKPLDIVRSLNPGDHGIQPDEILV